MTATEVITKIREEIEERIAQCDKRAEAAAEANMHNTMESNDLVARQYKSLLSFIDGLDEPVCEELKDEITRYDKESGVDAYLFGEFHLETLTEIARHFASWQKEQDTRDMYMSDNRHIQKVYELGKKDMKEQMLQDAVDAEYSATPFGTPMLLFNGWKGHEFGDRVKIIIVDE